MKIKLDPKLKDYILKRGKEIGYLECLKEMYREDMFDINDAMLIKDDYLLFRLLSEECENKRLIKNGRQVNNKNRD